MLSLLGAAIAPPAGTGSPLGRFADVVTALVSVFVIVADVYARMNGIQDSQLDTFAILAIGILYGGARGIQAGHAQSTSELTMRANLNTELALAAHRRLDDMKAPAAALNHTGLAVGQAGDVSPMRGA